MLSATTEGSFDNVESFIKRMAKSDPVGLLSRFGQAGVVALAKATPTESGKTARSWGYRIVKTRTGHSVEWFNTNVNQGAQIAILIQYGHGTGTGGYISGIDYINPAIRPIFEQTIAELWREVQR